MFSFDIFGMVNINGKEITLGHYLKNRRINKLIFYDEHIYVCTHLSEHILSLYPALDIEADNIFKFDIKGQLIFKTGLLKLKEPVHGKKEFEASNLTILENQLLLGHGIGYEAWADIETGEILRGRFEGKK